jgi:hypothetical protein
VTLVGTLPYYGAEAFALNAIGEQHVTDRRRSLRWSRQFGWARPRSRSSAVGCWSSLLPACGVLVAVGCAVLAVEMRRAAR